MPLHFYSHPKCSLSYYVDRLTIPGSTLQCHPKAPRRPSVTGTLQQVVEAEGRGGEL